MKRKTAHRTARHHSSRSPGTQAPSVRRGRAQPAFEEPGRTAGSAEGEPEELEILEAEAQGTEEEGHSADKRESEKDVDQE